MTNAVVAATALAVSAEKQASPAPEASVPAPMQSSKETSSLGKPVSVAQGVTSKEGMQTRGVDPKARERAVMNQRYEAVIGLLQKTRESAEKDSPEVFRRKLLGLSQSTRDIDALSAEERKQLNEIFEKAANETTPAAVTKLLAGKLRMFLSKDWAAARANQTRAAMVPVVVQTSRTNVSSETLKSQPVTSAENAPQKPVKEKTAGALPLVAETTLAKVVAPAPSESPKAPPVAAAAPQKTTEVSMTTASVPAPVQSSKDRRRDVLQVP